MKICHLTVCFPLFVAISATVCAFEVLGLLSYSVEGSGEDSLVTLFNNVNQSIVQVNTAGVTSVGTRPGSGFIYDDLGHIVTSYHVLASPLEGRSTNLSDRNFHITFIDGATYTGSFVGADPYSELAVLRIENITGKIFPLHLGNSSQLRIGQPVLAAGNPFGISLTEGIVSGFGRISPSSGPQDLSRQRDTQSFLIPNLVHTDAAINLGNAGGPLLNTGGEVVGMISDTTEYEGIGSAIPSDVIRKVVPELISTGAFRHPYVGIAGVDISPEIARRMDLNDSKGFLVTEVTEGSPAEKSGIRGGRTLDDINGRQMELGGDVIIAVDNVTVRNIEDLLSYLQSERSVGEVVILSVLRDGKIQEIAVTVGARPSQ